MARICLQLAKDERPHSRALFSQGSLLPRYHWMVPVVNLGNGQTKNRGLPARLCATSATQQMPNLNLCHIHYSANAQLGFVSHSVFDKCQTWLHMPHSLFCECLTQFHVVLSSLVSCPTTQRMPSSASYLYSTLFCAYRVPWFCSSKTFWLYIY